MGLHGGSVGVGGQVRMLLVHRSFAFVSWAARPGEIPIPPADLPPHPTSPHPLPPRGLQAGTAAGRALTDLGSTRAWGLLTYAPYLVPFHERARVFQTVVSQVGCLWMCVGEGVWLVFFGGGAGTSSRPWCRRWAQAGARALMCVCECGWWVRGGGCAAHVYCPVGSQVGWLECALHPSTPPHDPTPLTPPHSPPPSPQERARFRDMDVSHALALGHGLEPNRFITIRRTQVRCLGGRAGGRSVLGPEANPPTCITRLSPAVCPSLPPSLQVLQDGYERLSALGEGLRGRVRVQFISEHGLEEAGVDGGGIFKEFLEDVSGVGRARARVYGRGAVI